MFNHALTEQDVMQQLHSRCSEGYLLCNRLQVESPLTSDKCHFTSGMLFAPHTFLMIRTQMKGNVLHSGSIWSRFL